MKTHFCVYFLLTLQYYKYYKKPNHSPIGVVFGLIKVRCRCSAVKKYAIDRLQNGAFFYPSIHHKIHTITIFSFICIYKLKEIALKSTNFYLLFFISYSILTKVKYFKVSIKLYYENCDFIFHDMNNYPAIKFVKIISLKTVYVYKTTNNERKQ